MKMEGIEFLGVDKDFCSVRTSQFKSDTAVPPETGPLYIDEPVWLIFII